MIGFSTGMTSVLIAHGRSLVPPHLLGRTITLLNIGTMGGGFLVQFVSGAIIDLFPDRGRCLSAGGLSRWCSPCRRFSWRPVAWPIGGSRESHSGR